MRVYEYSWQSDEKGIEITVDMDVLIYLIDAFKEKIKTSVANDGFESARRYFKDLDVLERKLNELLKRKEKEDADSESEQ